MLKALGFNSLKAHHFSPLVSNIKLHPYTTGGEEASRDASPAPLHVRGKAEEGGGEAGGGELFEVPSPNAGDQPAQSSSDAAAPMSSRAARASFDR